MAFWGRRGVDGSGNKLFELIVRPVVEHFDRDFANQIAPMFDMIETAAKILDDKVQ